MGNYKAGLRVFGIIIAIVLISFIIYFLYEFSKEKPDITQWNDTVTLTGSIIILITDIVGLFFLFGKTRENPINMIYHINQEQQNTNTRISNIETELHTHIDASTTVDASSDVDVKTELDVFSSRRTDQKFIKTGMAPIIAGPVGGDVNIHYGAAVAGSGGVVTGSVETTSKPLEKRDLSPSKSKNNDDASNGNRNQSK